MYTIKTNILKDVKGELDLDKTFYMQAEKITVQRFDSDGGKLMDLLCEKFSGANTFVINPSDTAVRLTVIGYFDANGEYRHLAINNPADVYIMQNGKTIDRISV